MPAAAPTFVLVVTRGRDAGARVVVGATPKVIGRSRSSDLLLSDPGVSRKHCEVVATEKGVSVRCAPGATPIVVRGAETTDALIAPGDSIVIADTLLGVLPQAESAGGDATTLGFLFAGLASDVKSLRSISELLDSLDVARDEAAIEAALGAWSEAHAGAKGTRLALADALAQDAEFAALASGAANVVRVARGASSCEVAVPAYGATPHAIVFALPIASDGATEELLRLLAVAGRVAGSALSRVAVQRSLEADVASLRTMALGSSRDFLGRSAAAAEVTRLMQRLAASDSTALLLGESGTGKSFVARLIHEASARAREPFRVINCAAIPENLVESELFGHERGAFSGAVSAHAGAFESAGRGTILLDEIGELPLASQAKLLRVLEERTFERVGGSRSLRLTARVLAATNRDLADMVARRLFREDLYYRVSVVTMRVPPLRERGEDVVMLAQQMLADLAHTAGRRVSAFDAEALAALRAYSWPGNVRELRNAVEHALVLGSKPVVEAADLPETVRGAKARAASATSISTSAPVASVTLPARLDWLEKQAIDAALQATGGKRTKAAELLGIDRATLYKKLLRGDTEKK